MAVWKKTERPTGRIERLRVALRENLKRRKMQARGRATPSEGLERSAPPNPKAGERSPGR